MSIDSLLLASARLCTFAGDLHLTNASSFFFERGGRLFLVTSRHVMRDDASGHRPDRIEIELHIDPDNIAQIVPFSIPLYREDAPLWRQGIDQAGEIDVAVIEIDRPALPETSVFHAFTPAHMVDPAENVDIGASVLIVGFPLGFHDTLHHTPVARQAAIASAFGLRFQGQGYFLTDARTHRGASGAPVVMRDVEAPSTPDDLPWRLLGVHSSRLDVGTRDLNQDEALGLNCAWYADILLTLTEDEPA
ncbi:S1 family peptidase [Methylocystis parvus]|uniref:Trypsin-like peptidase domain-containing protein n=1 Tax=Methylocystis parvus TaxID=134 RepID=A0A6B8M830_9HYPH|nr:serine protease [Methylocystis parvus]QGM98565.1 trypsin-like peptidase domain-containing protein [Methylocystis parvus]WBK01093.1 serine protease [Methylocystis parvus OBBP]